MKVSDAGREERRTLFTQLTHVRTLAGGRVEMAALCPWHVSAQQ